MTRWLSAIAVALVVAACSIGKIGNGVQDDETTSVNVLSGRVVDSEGRPVGGVRVAGGNLVAVSGEDGYWRMLATATETLPDVLTYFRRGYAPRTVVRSVVSATHQEIALQEALAMRTVVVADGAQINIDADRDGRDDVHFDFPPDFVNDLDTVDVTISYLAANAAGAVERFPGTFISQVNEDAAGNLARSFGAVNVSFHQGDRLLDSLQLDQAVGLEVVLGDADRIDLGDGETVDLSWLNTETGRWIQDAQGIVVVQNGIVSVTTDLQHFTWWNVERTIADYGCLALQLDDGGLLDNDFKQAFELVGRGERYLSAAPPQAFDLDGVARTTGWRGHTIAVAYRYRGAGPQGATFADIGAVDLTQRATGAAVTNPSGCDKLSVPFELRPGVINGFVLDAQRQPVSDTIVLIPELGLQTQPRPDGFFEIRNVPYTDSGVALSVRALPTATQRFPSESVVHRGPETRVDLQAAVHPRPPWFAEHYIGNSQPVSGDTVTFSFVVRDNEPGLVWSAVPTTGVVLQDHVEVTESDDGSVYELNISGAWRAQTTGPAQLLLSVRDSNNQTAEFVIQAVWQAP